MWNLQVRILLVGKQVREVRQQTSVGTPKALVGVLPLVSTGRCQLLRDRSLRDERLPLGPPRSQGGREGRLGRVRQCARESGQLNGCRQLRISGEVPVHDLDLVEVAHLDGEPFLERFADAFTPIHDEGLDGPARGFELIHAANIIRRGLVRHREPAQVLLEFVGPKHHHANTTTQVKGVGREHDWPGRERSGCWLVGTNLLPQPGGTFPVRFSQLLVGLFLPDVLIEKLGLQPSPPATSILKLLPTTIALVAGPTRLHPNADRVVRRTGRT